LSHHASWFFLFAMGIGLFSGFLLGVQPSVNGMLGRLTQHPLQASTISFASGTALLVVVTIAMGIFPPQLKVPAGALPWWAWSGGVIGTVMVTTSLFFVPRIGALAWFSVVMTGQVFAALALDHYGWLGTPRQPAHVLRYVGAALLVMGILCISASRRAPSSNLPSKSGQDHAQDR